MTAAAFYYDYTDQQVRGKLVDPVFDILDTLLNIPKSRVYGAEADLILRPTRELTLQGDVTYLKSSVLTSNGVHFVSPTAYGNSCTTSAGLPGPCDFTGAELPFTPEWSYSGTVDYRHELGNGGAIIAGVDLHGQSSSVATLNGRSIVFRNLPGSDRHITTTDHPFVIEPYALVDAQLGYQLPGGRVKVSIWAKNIFNKYYLTNINQYLDDTVRFAGQPATYGVTLSFRN